MTLALESVSVVRGTARLIDRVSIACRPGEIVAIVGPNGAGKTTVLSVLSGDLQPTSGSARLDGEEIHRLTPDVLARRRSVMPQSSQPAFGFRVFELVGLGRAPYAEDPRALGTRVEAALAEVDALHLAGREVATLSGGERQRVTLARALAQLAHPCDGGSRFLLLDEPTASLDLKQTEGVLDIVQRVARAGIGVLAILHDIGAVRAVADRCIGMSCGQVAFDGSPGEVLDEHAIVELFELSPNRRKRSFG